MNEAYFLIQSKIAALMLVLGSLSFDGIVYNDSNEYGRIGVRTGWGDKIGHVYTHSPAHDAGLQKDDKIIEADGIPGGRYVTGIAGIPVRLKIQRGETILEFEVMRVIPEEVWDVRDSKKRDR